MIVSVLLCDQKNSSCRRLDMTCSYFSISSDLILLRHRQVADE